MNISNGTITEITRDRKNTLLNVEYDRERIRILVDDRTVILNRRGQEIMRNDLREGMVIDARVSDAMTRSIPPQATAFLIRVIRDAMPGNPSPGRPPGQGNPGPGRPPGQGNPGPGRPPGNVTVGRIWNIDRNARVFDTITGQNISTLTRFNVPESARIFDRMGRPVNFSRLMIGMQVEVRHANFMTASIPPQTTAFEVRIL